ncbi:hypothetical protein V6N13_024920 [Hibiscus sabdariffa]
MWEMHSRLSQHDAANISINSMKDHWIPAVSVKILIVPFAKAQSIHDVGSRFDRETSSDSLSTEQKDKPSYGRRISSAWPLQESHETYAFSSNHSESYSTTIGGLPTAASSLARIEMRPQMGSSHFWQQRFQSLGTASPPEQSPLRQYSPSPSFPARHTHYLPHTDPNLSYHHYSLSQQPKLDPVQVESSGQTQKPLLSQISEVGTTSIFGNATETNLLDIGTSESSSTSSLLVAVMKSGILSKNSLIDSSPIKIPRDLEQVLLQPSLPSQSLPAIFTLSSSASHDAISTATNSSQGKVEQLLQILTARIQFRYPTF